MDGEEGGCVHDKDARSSGRCDIGIWHGGAETREGNLGVDSMTCSRGEGWSKRRDLHPRKVVSHCTKGSKEVGASASCVPIWASAPEEPYTAPYKEHRAGWGQNLTQVPHLWVIKKGESHVTTTGLGSSEVLDHKAGCQGLGCSVGHPFKRFYSGRRERRWCHKRVYKVR